MENKKYWLNLEELEGNPEELALQSKEFPKDPIEEAMNDDLKSNRRNFLKFFGFSIGAASLATACEKTPVKYALPYVNKPPESLPSVPNYYSSTFFDGLDFCNILVKTREGRPIKIEGNKESITAGGVSARGQATVLGVYDENRLRAPLFNKSNVTWGLVDGNLQKALNEIKGRKGNIRILTSTIISPSTKALIADFIKAFPGTKHVTYDPISASAILEANEASFKKRVIPRYRFDNANVIVGINADFLGTWLSPTEYANLYSKKRRMTPEKKLSRHIQFESNLSLTGANADVRMPMKPSQEGPVVLKLYNEIAAAKGKPAMGTGIELAGNSVSAAAKELLANPGRSLVVCGSNDPKIQMFVNAINSMLGNYGSTIDLQNYSKLRQGVDSEMIDLVKEMESGQVDALLMYETNPMYTYPDAGGFKNALSKVKLTVDFVEAEDETSKQCNYVLPLHHLMESWGDAEPYDNYFSLVQPAINPLFDTRQFQDSLLKWMGADVKGPEAAAGEKKAEAKAEEKKAEAPKTEAKADDKKTDAKAEEKKADAKPEEKKAEAPAKSVERGYLAYLKNYWRTEVYPIFKADVADEARNFDEFWVKSLDWGVVSPDAYIPADVLAAEEKAEKDAAAKAKAGAKAEKQEAKTEAPEAEDDDDAPAAKEAPAQGREAKLGAELSAEGIAAGQGLELLVYTKISMGTGSMAANPWLQELPDPITKVAWDNYAAIPIKIAKEQGIKTGDVVKIEAGKFNVELPALVQPGLQAETIAIALGYGRTVAGIAALPNPDDSTDKKGGNAYPGISVKNGNFQYYTGGVKISKTGNKYPLAITQIQGTVMGREEVVKETILANYDKDIKAHQDKRSVIAHHMVNLYPTHASSGHKWVMVIDLNLCTGCGACVVACNVENNVPVVGKKEVTRNREMHWLRIDRYYSAEAGKGNEENPAENPQVIFQPMLCQHCNNAPCENVCPVLATVHSSEGLNQQAYNRCFGTRYCANNCPYKVRRFNWLDYANQDTPLFGERGFIDSKTKFKYNPATRYGDKNSPTHLGALVLNPDVTVRARGTMEKCSFCVQRIQYGKLEAKKEGRKLIDNVDIQVACQQTCPTGAIKFGDMNDPESEVRKLFHSERSFQVIEEVKTYPSISYLVKVRNRNEADNKTTKTT